MILLDTDHISILQRPSSARSRLLQRLDSLADSPVTSVITLEEQSRSWITEIGRRRNVADQVSPYGSLGQMFEFFAEWEIVPFTSQAAETFTTLRSDGVRISSSDLKIASIAIINNATLLTANSRHFEKVPGLRFEDWLS
jgi:tRNA(fMet)-specific endonuclease VapC